MTVSAAASFFDFSAKGRDFSASSSFVIHIFIYTLLSYITIPTKIMKFKPMLQSRQVKHTPQNSINKLIIWKMKPLVVPVTGVTPACVMSSEYFKRTSLYLVSLKIFEWVKLLRRHLHQIQGNWDGRNFITASRVNSRHIHYTCKNAEMDLKVTTTNGFNFWILSSLMASWGYAWPGLTVKLNLNRKVQLNCKTHCVCFL